MAKSPARSGMRLDLGTQTFKGLGVHVSLLWLVMLFVLVTVIVCTYAGLHQGLGKREFPDTVVNGDLTVKDRFREQFRGQIAMTATALTLQEGYTYTSAVVQPGNITLPNPSGMIGGKIRILVDVVGTTSAYTITTPAGTFYDATSDLFLGLTNATVGFTLSTRPNGTANNTLTMTNGNGAWGIGSVIDLTATDSTHWRIIGHCYGSTGNAVTGAFTTV